MFRSQKPLPVLLTTSLQLSHEGLSLFLSLSLSLSLSPNIREQQTGVGKLYNYLQSRLRVSVQLTVQ